MTKEERRAMRLERKQNAKEAKEKNRENCGTLKEQYANLWFIYKFISVSYTHLTLPTT